MGPCDSPSPESVFRVPGGQEVRWSSSPGTSQGMGLVRTIRRFLGWHVVELDGDGDGLGGVPREGDRVGYCGTLPGAIFWSSQD